MENSFPATSATLEIVSAWFCSPISRHLENVREALGCTTTPSSVDSCCQCLEGGREGGEREGGGGRGESEGEGEGGGG